VSRCERDALMCTPLAASTQRSGWSVVICHLSVDKGPRTKDQGQLTTYSHLCISFGSSVPSTHVNDLPLTFCSAPVMTMQLQQYLIAGGVLFLLFLLLVSAIV